MSDFTIRPYRASDLERCRALWVELTQRHRNIYDDPNIGGDAPGLYFDKHLAQVGPERVWVAECDEVVGLVSLIVEGKEAKVEPIVVAATHRGQGIGQALIERMVKEAKELEMSYLNVKPVARNVEAIAFYHAAGLNILGNIEMFMDLRSPASTGWKSGVELFGRTFEY